MLQPALDTLQAHEIGAPLAAVDTPHDDAFASRAPAETPRSAASTGRAGAHPIAPNATHADGSVAVGGTRAVVDRMAHSTCHREAGDRHCLASTRRPPVWTWKSRRRRGRPTTPTDVRTLIRTMAEANPRWGAPRIHGELLRVGIDVSQATVAKYIGRRHRPPSQTWRTCLQNHVGQIVAADFFVVPTVTCRLVFVLVRLAHDRRRIRHVAVTAHPTAAWTAQQLREAFPWDDAPRYVITIVIMRSTTSGPRPRRWAPTTSARLHTHRGSMPSSSGLSDPRDVSVSIT